jgi:phosphoglycerate-specific signal transduction histidine kinase
VPHAEQQARLDEAFERIEETILPCIAMMLETLIDASESVAENERRFLAAELKTLAAQLEELTQAVERSSPVYVRPGEFKARNVA